jgi:hypothetical protein
MINLIDINLLHVTSFTHEIFLRNVLKKTDHFVRWSFKIRTGKPIPGDEEMLENIGTN